MQCWNSNRTVGFFPFGPPIVVMRPNPSAYVICFIWKNLKGILTIMIRLHASSFLRVLCALCLGHVRRVCPLFVQWTYTKLSPSCRCLSNIHKSWAITITIIEERGSAWKISSWCVAWRMILWCWCSADGLGVYGVVGPIEWPLMRFLVYQKRFKYQDTRVLLMVQTNFG